MLTSIRAGTIGTVAGKGEPGYLGDGGSALHACLNEPKSLAFDREGNLYIADSENHVIRKVDCHTGVITTAAGCSMDGNATHSSSSTPEEPMSEESGDDPLADPEDSAVPQFTQSTDISGMVRYVVGQSAESKRFRGDGGLASQATLNFPSAVVVDQDGSLYIADTWNHRIRKVDSTTGIISTVAGTGQAKFTGDGGPATAATLNEPVALVVDNTGHLYIADQNNNRVRMVDLQTGLITTIAGTGEAAYTGDGMLATETGLAGPSGLALDEEGNLYVADTFSGRIRKIEAKTGIVSTAIGDGGEFHYQAGYTDTTTSLSRPYGIALDRKENLLITDSDNHLLRKWDKDRKTIIPVAGNGIATFAGDDESSEKISLNFPFGVAVDPQGNIGIADTFNHRIRMIVV